MHLHKIIFHLSNQTRFDTDKLLRTEALDSNLLHGFVDWFTLQIGTEKGKKKHRPGTPCSLNAGGGKSPGDFSA